jgi:hypothetical protein
MLAPIILALSLLLGGYAPAPAGATPTSTTVTPYDGGSGGPPMLP